MNYFVLIGKDFMSSGILITYIFYELAIAFNTTV